MNYVESHNRMIAEALNVTHISIIYATKNLNHMERSAHNLQGLENCLTHHFSQ